MLFKQIWLALACSLVITSARGQIDGVKLQNGDLLFQNLDCGPLCDAIEEVTAGFDGNDFSHIGLVHIEADSVYVIEAIGKGVHLTPLKAFIARSAHKVYVGRLKPRYAYLNQEALRFALSQMDKPYDDEFIYDNGRYYCSELIYDAYMKANYDKPFFTLEPMTFKRPGKDEFFPAWVEYYDRLDMPIPEGKPGINPGGISSSDKIVILNK
jgi:hypothetical protein